MDRLSIAPPPKYPLKIVSDLHYRNYGARLKQPEDVLPIFRGFATVVLNGDTVEQSLWGTDAAGRHLHDIQAVAKSVGTELIFVRGNHDDELGVHEYRIPHQDRVIRITHGDFGLLQLENRPYSAFKRPFEYAWHHLKLIKTYPVYWRQIEMGLKLAQPGEILVLGHTHQPSVTKQDGKVVVNLGAHMKPFRSAWIEIQNPESQVVFHGKETVVL